MTNITVTPLKNGKEQITVNGEVFLKAAPAGKWQYIIVVTETGSTLNSTGTSHIGKSASAKSAANWTPFPMVMDYYKIYNPEAYAEALEKGAKKINNCGGIARLPIEYTREVIEIKR